MGRPKGESGVCVCGLLIHPAHAPSLCHDRVATQCRRQSDVFLHILPLLPGVHLPPAFPTHHACWESRGASAPPVGITVRSLTLPQIDV